MRQFDGYDLTGIGVSKRPSQKDQILNAMRDMKLREDQKRYEEYLIRNSDGQRSSSPEYSDFSGLERRTINPQDLYEQGEMPSFHMKDIERSKKSRQLKALQMELAERDKEINL